MSNPNWTLDSSGDVYATLRSELYCNLVGHDKDALLAILGERLTAAAIKYITNTTITTPPADLKHALCQQAAFKWKRREWQGLQSVSMLDGNTNTFSTEEWLPEVKAVLDRYRHYVLYETVPTV